MFISLATMQFFLNISPIQCLSVYLIICLSLEAIYLKSVSKLDLELEVDMGLLKYLLCIFIFSIILQNMTLKRILGIGPNTGKWQKVNGKGIKSLSIIFTPYLPLRSTYANLIEKTLKEVPMTTLQVRRVSVTVSIDVIEEIFQSNHSGSTVLTPSIDTTSPNLTPTKLISSMRR